MKTFTTTLIAAGVGLLGMCGAATAATPYGSFGSTQGIAVGGCYKPAAETYCDQYGGCFGPAYRPSTAYDDYAYRPLPSRSVYDSEPDYHTLPYPTSRVEDCGWDQTVRSRGRYGDFNHSSANRWSNHSTVPFDRGGSRFDNRRYEDRYGSPMFEPWRPMSASNSSFKW